MPLREVTDIQLDNAQDVVSPSGFVEVQDIQLDKPSLYDRAREIFGERQGELARISADYYPEQTVAEDALQAIGQVGSGVGELGFEAVKRGVQAVTPDFIEDAVVNKAKELAQTETGQAILGKIQEYGQDYAKFAQENPRMARNLSGIVGTAEVVPVAAGVKAGATGAAKGVGRYAPPSRKEEIAEVFKSTGDEVTNIQDRVSKLSEVRKSEYQDLYKAAEELGEGSFVKGKSASDLVGKLEFLKGKTYQPSEKDTLENIIKTVKGLKTADGMNLNVLAGIRRDLGKSISESRAKGIIDDVISDAVDKGDISGSPEAGKLWKDATNQFRQYKQTFDNPKMNPTIKAIVDTDLTPEDLSSKMFGAGSIGTGRKAGQKYDEFVRVLGKEVEPDLKKAVVGKIMNFSLEPSESMRGNQVWLQRVAREVSNLKGKNKTLWNKFSAEEKEALTRMGEMAQRASEGGVVNKTVDGVLNIANNLLSKTGLRTSLRLPSTLQPKQLASEADVLDLSRSRTPTRTQRLKQDIGIE